MPNGPNGEKRPAVVIANAVRVARIATGEVAETFANQPQREPAREGRPPKPMPETGKEAAGATAPA